MGRQAGREAGRQGGREAERQRGREAGRQGGREAGRGLTQVAVFPWILQLLSVAVPAMYKPPPCQK